MGHGFTFLIMALKKFCGFCRVPRKIDFSNKISSLELTFKKKYKKVARFIIKPYI
jgi:hypothetical protein